MKVLQINAVYEKFSTGRSTQELHEAMLKQGIDSYVACRDLASLTEHSYKIGNKIDWILHSLLSRIFGLQGYFSKHSTKKLLKYIDNISPDIIHLGNLHSNFINLPMLLEYISEKDIATVLTLHDSWFYTGKCVYYVQYKCDRWRKSCGNCPALKSDNPSWFFDKSTQILKDKERLFTNINRLAVIGVSQWVTNDASKSILKTSKEITCIYNWIDLNLFKPQNCDIEKINLNFENKFIIFGIAMSWNTLKGINIFHELADKLPSNCQIILAGDDSQIIKKHPKIHYVGTITDVNVISKLYSMADVFVNPTIQETFGKTTAEALSCGTPVVAYNGTATPELVGTDEKCGYLVDKNDSDKYLEKILQVQTLGKNYFSKNARERSLMLFSKEKNIKMHIDLYKRLIEE